MERSRHLQRGRSRNPLLIAIIATVIGVAGLTVGAFLLFGAAQESPPSQPSTAFSFAVFAGSTVMNVGESVITGDLGGAKTGQAITGFPPGVVYGAQHPGDAVALQAKEDLTTAYFDAANRTADDTLPPEIGGLVLGPGVYNQATDLFVTGTLTLDGQNDPAALFIFQTGTLGTAAASIVTLVNGAQACNVFWQVGDSATLGTTTTFAGTIMATTAVTLQTGATVDGRVLARSGGIALDSNTITEPACSTDSTEGIPSTAAPTAAVGQSAPTTSAAAGAGRAATGPAVSRRRPRPTDVTDD